MTKDIYPNIAEKKYTAKSRLDLNDLLQRIEEEKKIDKKKNIIIISGVASVAALVFVGLSL